MAYQKIACPHCRVTKYMKSEGSIGRSHWAHFLFKCDSCDGAIVVKAEARNPPREFKHYREVSCADYSFEECGWRIVDSNPKPVFDRGIAPECAPNEVRAIIEHAHEAAERGGYELAMIGYQRAVMLIRRVCSPDFRGNLHAWISAMVKAGALTENIKRWARRVKVRGAIDGATALDCEDFAAFLCTLIDQLFALEPRMAKFGNRAAS